MKEFLQKNGIWVVVGVVVVAALLWWSGLVKGLPGATASVATAPATETTTIAVPATTTSTTKGISYPNPAITTGNTETGSTINNSTPNQ